MLCHATGNSETHFPIVYRYNLLMYFSPLFGHFYTHLLLQYFEGAGRPHQHITQQRLFLPKPGKHPTHHGY